MNNLEEIKENITREETCPICHGEGIVEAYPRCFRPASYCCGGCSRKEDCEECDGSGIVKDERRVK